VVITVTPVNDPPEKANILTPANGTTIQSGQLLDFQGTCVDPDLDYGDVLTFSWYSDLSGILGTGSFLNDIKLPVGEHNITLTVTDSSNASTNTSIKIKVYKSVVSKGDDNNSGILLGSIISFFIIILILFLLIRKNQKTQHMVIFKKIDESTIAKNGKTENKNLQRIKNKSKDFLMVTPDDEGKRIEE
jgi:large-conductance mechanosensitive channel